MDSHFEGFLLCTIKHIIGKKNVGIQIKVTFCKTTSSKGLKYNFNLCSIRKGILMLIVTWKVQKLIHVLTSWAFFSDFGSQGAGIVWTTWKHICGSLCPLGGMAVYNHTANLLLTNHLQVYCLWKLVKVHNSKYFKLLVCTFPEHNKYSGIKFFIYTEFKGTLPATLYEYRKQNCHSWYF